MSKRSLYTSSFKEIIQLFLMLCFIAVTIIVWILHMMPQYSNEYTGALMDKVERLKAIDESKIILVGDSNVAFGIDSEALESAFGMPVVNMGLHASLGNAFHENLVKFNVGEGDIIIVSHITYYDDGTFGDPLLGWITLEDHWHLWKAVDYKMMRQLIKSFPIYLKKIINLWSNEKGNLVPDSIYARVSFNEYGDIRIERTESELDMKKATVMMPAIKKEVAERLNNFKRYFQDKGAVLVITAYPILNDTSVVDKQDYIKFQEELEAALDVPVISDFTDYIFEPQYFYDVNYPLTDEGSKLWTNLLIEDIRRWDRQQVYMKQTE